MNQNTTVEMGLQKCF